LPIFSATANGSEITFSNNSLNATSYFWDFGDGGTSTLSSPTHTYTTTGAFTIMLIAYNSCGSDTFISIIKVFVSSIDQLEDNRTCILLPNPADEYFEMMCTSGILSEVKINFMDVAGKPVSYKGEWVVKNETNKLIVDISGLPAGIYLVTIQDSKSAGVYKLVVR
jgi:PKD repeat protein